MKTYRDEIALVCHEMMKAGQSIGAIDDEEMREFEENAFVSTLEAPGEVPGASEPAHPQMAVSPGRKTGSVTLK